MFQKLVVDGKDAEVLEYSSKEERKGRPAGLNTVEMLKVASSALNIGPHHAMQVRTIEVSDCLRRLYSLFGAVGLERMLRQIAGTRRKKGVVKSTLTRERTGAFRVG